MDLRCFDDLDLFGAECESPLEELEQDIIHRLTSRRGSNLDDPDAGEDIADWLSSSVTAPVARHRIEAEVRKDPRVGRVRATVTQVRAGEYRINLEVYTNEEELLSIGLTVDADGARKVAA